MRARHVDLWLDHKDIGKVSMGHGSIAGDASGLYELSGVSFVFGFAGTAADGTGADATVPVYSGTGVTAADGTRTYAERAADSATSMNVRGKPRGFRPFNFFGARENRIRYDTPSLMGLRASASYGESKGWSVGLSYAGAPPGVKDFTALFSAGYRKRDNDTTAFAVSGGIKHSSGFNLSGHFDSDGEAHSPKDGLANQKNSQWGVSGGWSGKVNDAGGTSIGVGYNRSTDGLMGVAQEYWIAIVQKVDAAAADVYAGVSYDSGTLTHQVTAAEALGANRAPTLGDAATAPVSRLEAKPTPCYTENPDTAGQFARAAAGEQCQVSRDGVINFVAGVRIKF